MHSCSLGPVRPADGDHPGWYSALTGTTANLPEVLYGVSRSHCAGLEESHLLEFQSKNVNYIVVCMKINRPRWYRIVSLSSLMSSGWLKLIVSSLTSRFNDANDQKFHFFLKTVKRMSNDSVFRLEFRQICLITVSKTINCLTSATSFGLVAQIYRASR